jgi:hypothetical protein
VQANATIEAGGTLATVATYWVVTALGSGGETLKSNEKTLTPAGFNLAALIAWAAVPNATGYRIYRSTSTGTYTTPCLVGSTPGDTLFFQDRGQALRVGAPPSSVPAKETPPNFKQAIGVNNDSVEGTDITIPIFKFTFNYYPATALMTPEYYHKLSTLAGRVNRDAWKGFDAGEVLYLGTAGQPRSADDWELTMHFIASPNASELKVGDIENIVKGGHEYLWIRFGDSVDANTLTKVPQFAYVERMYEPADFEDLGIGS